MHRMYSYRTHQLQADRGVTDWIVTSALGRWKISVKLADTSNTVEFKVDKRAQIVQLAKHWAEVWPSLNYPHDVVYYPHPPVPGQMHVFNACDGFAAYVYSHLGLFSGDSPLGVAAPYPNHPVDSGLGALRLFRQWSDYPVTEFRHCAIIVSTGEMVDVDNAKDITGPTFV